MYKRALVFTLILAIMIGCIPFLENGKEQTQEDLPIVNLTIDVIPGADVGSGSRENWLRERAEEFEKERNHFYTMLSSGKRSEYKPLWKMNNPDTLR